MLNIIFTTFANILFNTAIAGLLTAVGFGGGFWDNMVFSQCIGLSIYAANASVICHITDKRWRWGMLAFTFPGSIVFGVTLGAWITGAGDWSNPQAWVAVIIGLFFGGIGSIAYLLNQRIEQLGAEVKQRRLNEMESEKRQMEAQLKMLQAQIEPHFLFNTLANVSSLIDSDPALSKKLLERLNDWLRIALVRARSDNATLGDELEMLENYLQILKIRFGDRLRWTTDVDEEARSKVFPPMLLQPLVENAVRHGIEPKIGGGEIQIRASLTDTLLRIEVSDTGVGLISKEGGGTGLANIRARLATLYGERGRLTIQNGHNGGVAAILELPR
ncbi:MAG: sensor histidine kinase [Sideroxydans sp.]|nr:sensor histidine kinase [Sideroxydans sp.]